MKNNIIKFALSLSLLFFYCSFQYTFTIHSFNHTEVKNYIDYLSSDNFKGRLAGTLENQEAAAFIKGEFENLGLIPFEGDYYDPFNAPYPNKLNQDPFLKILDKNGKTIKNYKYNEDYKEDMLNFKKNNLNFSQKDTIKMNNTALQIIKDNEKYIFYVPEGSNLSFRSSFISTDSNSLYVMITQKTLNEIKNYISKGNTISCYIPFEIKDAKLNNVIGYIRGRNSKAAPLIISGHFDHLGTDLNGTIYSGALDNASGISFVLEFARYIKSLGTPERNIIFVGFNAEEFGCIGSNKFVEKYKDYLKGAKAYNFDMIGSNNSVPLSIMAGEKDTVNSEFMRSLTSTLSSEKVSYSCRFENSSDHEAFRKNNIDAVTFCDDDLTRIHTPSDKSSFISTNSIDRCFTAASVEVIKQAFDGNPMFIHYKTIVMVSFLSTLILYALYRRMS
jgi:hypothetical protein